MHHYTAHTYQSLSVVGITDATWQLFVPRQALTHRFLLHGLMGLAALHLANTTTLAEEREAYVRLTQTYQDSAFRLFSESLDNIGPGNCDAMMAFSIMAMVFATAMPKALADTSVLDRTFALLSFLQGIGTVTEAGREWLVDGPFGLFLDIDSRIPLEVPSGEDEAMLARLRRINDGAVGLVDPAGYDAIELAISRLERTFRGGELMVLAWLSMCGEGYIAMLRQGHRVALLVFLHWALPLHRLERLWWVEDMAHRLVDEVSPTLERLGPEWLAAVQHVRARLLVV
jgi:hypothetical protein